MAGTIISMMVRRVAPSRPVEPRRVIRSRTRRPASRASQIHEVA
jgi:hypothetical protein